ISSDQKHVSMLSVAQFEQGGTPVSAWQGLGEKAITAKPLENSNVPKPEHFGLVLNNQPETQKPGKELINRSVISHSSNIANNNGSMKNSAGNRTISEPVISRSQSEPKQVTHSSQSTQSAPAQSKSYSAPSAPVYNSSSSESFHASAPVSNN